LLVRVLRERRRSRDHREKKNTRIEEYHLREKELQKYKEEQNILARERQEKRARSK